MTAEFFNQDPDDWKEQIKEAPDESLSQETPSVEQKTLPQTILGKTPVVCKSCGKRSFLKNLTTCLSCGSSKTVLAAITHYVEHCDSEDRDARYGRQKNSFRVACQPKPQLGTPLPQSITSVLSAVTCPKCLSEYGVTIDEKGIINNLVT